MPPPIRVLVVDDEPSMRDLLRQGLEAAGFAVVEAGDRAGVVDALETGVVDVVTLDLNLGGTDGLELARELRSRRNIPIIMITGRGDPDDRVKGLEFGADDYIVKPFLVREVVLRLRTVLARYEPLPSMAPAGGGMPRLRFETGTMDVARRELIAADGSTIQVTDAEMALLQMFLTHPQRVLSRDEITRHLGWREWSPLNRALDVHVARLRRKVELGETPRLIKSVRGVGYVFTGDVERL